MMQDDYNNTDTIVVVGDSSFDGDTTAGATEGCSEINTVTSTNYDCDGWANFEYLVREAEKVRPPNTKLHRHRHSPMSLF